MWRFPVAAIRFWPRLTASHTRKIYDGEPITYTAKAANGDAARVDPCGFYHGMTVRHAGTKFVLCGPPVSFVPGQSEQLALF